MLAAAGLFARRVWVFPHTTRLPPGATPRDITLNETDLYSPDVYNPVGKVQTWTFTVMLPGNIPMPLVAEPKLIEPGGGWENFEACMLSPTGKFLTGGYSPSANPPSFRTNKGFNSARELLRWWCTTTRENGRFHRFVCWVAQDGSRRMHYWDVDGRHYDSTNFQDIRNSGKDLPIP